MLSVSVAVFIKKKGIKYGTAADPKMPASSFDVINCHDYR
jgi:hypothetical protein